MLETLIQYAGQITPLGLLIIAIASAAGFFYWRHHYKDLYEERVRQNEVIDQERRRLYEERVESRSDILKVREEAISEYRRAHEEALQAKRTTEEELANTRQQYETMSSDYQRLAKFRTQLMLHLPLGLANVNVVIATSRWLYALREKVLVGAAWSLSAGRSQESEQLRSLYLRLDPFAQRIDDMLVRAIRFNRTAFQSLPDDRFSIPKELYEFVRTEDAQIGEQLYTINEEVDQITARLNSPPDD